MASHRRQHLQRWSARLAAYYFNIKYIRSADNRPAYALSRLPLNYEGRNEETKDNLNLVEDTIPVSYKEIRRKVA